jgi:flagellar biosynthesis protein FlhF
MELKRIHGRTLPETLARVERECGRDALVVETRRARDGYVVVAAAPGRAPAAPRTAPAPVRWTRGFRPLAERASAFGLSAAVLGAVERALLGTRVDLGRAGDPALGGVAARVLGALVPVRRLDRATDRVLALAGPTGVGKTTTLAKLAAACIAAGERVAVVTIDTWRIAAAEQLRAYAEMLSVPFTVALTPQELRRAVDAAAGADRILIDTAGRSPADGAALATLAGTLRASAATTLLCLPAGCRRADAGAMLGAYAPLAPGALVVTKWDETLAPGELLALAIERGLPITHLTIGQQVPQDLLVADARMLAAAAFGLDEALVAELL